MLKWGTCIGDTRNAPNVKMLLKCIRPLEKTICKWRVDCSGSFETAHRPATSAFFWGYRSSSMTLWQCDSPRERARSTRQEWRNIQQPAIPNLAVNTVKRCASQLPQASGECKKQLYHRVNVDREQSIRWDRHHNQNGEHQHKDVWNPLFSTAVLQQDSEISSCSFCKRPLDSGT